jgi:hypothetical protein
MGKRLTDTWWWAVTYKGGQSWAGVGFGILFLYSGSQIWEAGFDSWRHGQSPLFLGLGCLLLGLFDRACLLTSQFHQFVTLKEIVFDDDEGGMRNDVYMKLKTLFKP